jgi:hypothetical protein
MITKNPTDRMPIKPHNIKISVIPHTLKKCACSILKPKSFEAAALSANIKIAGIKISKKFI